MSPFIRRIALFFPAAASAIGSIFKKNIPMSADDIYVAYINGIKSSSTIKLSSLPQNYEILFKEEDIRLIVDYLQKPTPELAFQTQCYVNNQPCVVTISSCPRINHNNQIEHICSLLFHDGPELVASSDYQAGATQDFLSDVTTHQPASNMTKNEINNAFSLWDGNNPEFGAVMLNTPQQQPEDQPAPGSFMTIDDLIAALQAQSNETSAVNNG